LRIPSEFRARYLTCLLIGAGITPFAIVAALLIGTSLFGFLVAASAVGFLAIIMMVPIGVSCWGLKAWWVYAAGIAVPLTIVILPLAAALLGLRGNRYLLAFGGALAGLAAAAITVIPPHWLGNSPVPYDTSAPWNIFTAALIIPGPIAGWLAARLLREIGGRIEARAASKTDIPPSYR